MQSLARRSIRSSSYVALAVAVMISTTSDARAQQPGGSELLLGKLRELQAKVERLEAALDRMHNESASRDSSEHGGHEDAGRNTTSGESSMKDSRMSEKGMNGRMMGDGSNMSMMSEMSGMGMMGGRGMRMMGRVRGDEMQTPSALPGFPGASHIYHIGATSFFLDHPEHISLTQEQQTALNQIREDSVLEQADFDRRVEGAEQELWELTASDQPDAGKIEEKVREIADLQVSQRLAFIVAVGEAAEQLTDEQRQILVGQQSDAATSAVDSNQ